MNTTDDKILHYIWLSDTLRPGSRTPKILLEAMGGIEKVYSAGKDEYLALGIQTSEVQRLLDKDLTIASGHLAYCKTEHIGFLCYEDPYYPERLRIIDNPPPMFYYRGRLKMLDDYPCFAMVGTRKCSESGFRLAYKTAYECAASGAVIVNGMAAGIDGACIAGALDANAYAIGVIGCGIDRIYPSENKELFYRLSANGLILSEFPPFSEPKGSNFPVRNRVISGLCVASVIYEADAEKSGAMITAEHALTQGRRLFAVPGKPYDRLYSGSLELIKNGATVLTEASDILMEYAMMFPHRINTHHISTPSPELLDAHIKKHFKKSDKPVITQISETNKDKAPSYIKSTERQEKAKKAASAKFTEKAEEKLNASSAVKASARNVEKAPEEVKAPSAKKVDTSLLSETEKKIYYLFCEKHILTPDEIVSYGISIADVLSSITLLEVYGYISAKPGGHYELNEQ